MALKPFALTYSQQSCYLSFLSFFLVLSEGCPEIILEVSSNNKNLQQQIGRN
jgi:hypothetical protein